jgi:hypothetical protein
MGTFKVKRAAHGDDEALRLESSMDARSASIASAFLRNAQWLQDKCGEKHKPRCMTPRKRGMLVPREMGPVMVSRKG